MGFGGWCWITLSCRQLHPGRFAAPPSQAFRVLSFRPAVWCQNFKTVQLFLTASQMPRNKSPFLRRAAHDATARRADLRPMCTQAQVSARKLSIGDDFFLNQRVPVIIRCRVRLNVRMQRPRSNLAGPVVGNPQSPRPMTTPLANGEACL